MNQPLRLLLRPLLRAAFLAERTRRRLLQPITLGVRVLLVSDGRIVLVEHTYRRGWFLPGGGLKRNESLEDAARREAHEEAGATLGEMKLLGIYSNFKEAKNDHVAVFACTDFTLDGMHDAEIARVQTFPLDDLPTSLSPGTARRLAEFRSGAPPKAGRW
jgi:8-oxo-dGTP pyrophosphatase MutT (NUDIX family)